MSEEAILERKNWGRFLVIGFIVVMVTIIGISIYLIYSEDQYLKSPEGIREAYERDNPIRDAARNFAAKGTKYKVMRESAQGNQVIMIDDISTGERLKLPPDHLSPDAQGSLFLGYQLNDFVKDDMVIFKFVDQNWCTHNKVALGMYCFLRPVRE